jgi:hypothetical protein
MGYRGGCIIEIGPQRHRRASRDLHRDLSFLRFLVLWFRVPLGRQRLVTLQQ